MEYSNNLEDENDIDNIIYLIECLKGKDKKEKDKEKIVNEFLTQLISKQLFTKDEFFSFDKNLKTQNLKILKILLLCTLYEKEIIQKGGGEYYDKIKDVLDEINKDIGGGEIKKSKLDKFLANTEPIIKQRLSLINKIIKNFNPELAYDDLRKMDDKINRDLNKLQKIKDNITIYHKEFFKEIIDEISEVIKLNKNKKIKDYEGGKIGDLIQSLYTLAERVSRVKNFLLFKEIYASTFDQNENKRFDVAFNKLNHIKEYFDDKKDIIRLNKDYESIFNKIKEKLKNNEKEADDFIEKLGKYYEITNKELIDELTVLFLSEKYVLDIKSIKFFFENYFEKDNTVFHGAIYSDIPNFFKFFSIFSLFPHFILNINYSVNEKF